MKKTIMLLIVALMIVSVAASAEMARGVIKRYDPYGSQNSAIETYSGLGRQDRIDMLMGGGSQSLMRQEVSETVNDNSANSIYTTGPQTVRPKSREGVTRYAGYRERQRVKTTYSDNQYQGGTSSRMRFVRSNDRFYELRIGFEDATEKQIVKTFHVN